MLLADAGFEVIGEAGHPDHLIALVDSDEPDAAIVDIKMPPTFTDEGLRAAEEIRNRHPDIGVLVLSQYLEVHYAMTLIASQPGGVGYLLKDRVKNVAELSDAVERVINGQPVVDPGVVSELLDQRRTKNPLDDLTDREREVLSLMAEGRSNLAIENGLFISPRTVESHVRNILIKLGLEDTPNDHRRVLAVLTFLNA
jgi:DNA-binding NarL/FixJ family response regulator